MWTRRWSVGSPRSAKATQATRLRLQDLALAQAEPIQVDTQATRQRQGNDIHQCALRHCAQRRHKQRRQKPPSENTQMAVHRTVETVERQSAQDDRR